MIFKGKDTDKTELIAYIFDHYQEGLVQFAEHFLQDTKRAEDVVQEVVIKVWQKENVVFEEEPALRAYLYRSVRNACINDLNKLDTLRYTIDIIHQEIQEEKKPLLFDEKVITEIQERINGLPAQTQRVVKGVFMEGKRYQQVADELGISINTVKTLLRTGVKSLRNDFEGREDIFYSNLLFLACYALT